MDQSQSCKSVGWNLSLQLLLHLPSLWDRTLPSGFFFLPGILGMKHTSDLLVPNVTMDHKVGCQEQQWYHGQSCILVHSQKGSLTPWIDISWVFLDIWILGTSKDRKKIWFLDILNKPPVNFLLSLHQLSWTICFEGGEFQHWINENLIF